VCEVTARTLVRFNVRPVSVDKIRPGIAKVIGKLSCQVGPNGID
jgi:hypothetical protein